VILIVVRVKEANKEMTIAIPDAENGKGRGSRKPPAGEDTD
jgi:hypothetical protein